MCIYIYLCMYIYILLFNRYYVGAVSNSNPLTRSTAASGVLPLRVDSLPAVPKRTPAKKCIVLPGSALTNQASKPNKPFDHAHTRTHSHRPGLACQAVHHLTLCDLHLQRRTVHHSWSATAMSDLATDYNKIARPNAISCIPSKHDAEIHFQMSALVLSLGSPAWARYNN